MAYFDRDPERREDDNYRHGGRGADPQDVKDWEKEMVKAERRDNLHSRLRKALEKGLVPQKPEEAWGERMARALGFARQVSRWYHGGRVDEEPSFD